MKPILLIGMSIIILSACGKDAIENDVSTNIEEVNGNNITVNEVEQELDKILEEQSDSIEYPLGVQNGKVSKDYYKAILTYHKISEDFNKETEEIEVNKNLYSDEERFQKHIELNNNKIIDINEIKHEPTNDIEREIDKYFTDTLYYEEEMSEYKAKYYSTKDETYYDLADSARDSYIHSKQLLLDVIEKYDLHDN